MRQLVLIFVLFVSTAVLSQEYGRKSYYIIDSLDLSVLNSSDSSAIYQTLNEYHTTKNSVSRLVLFSEISNSIDNIDAQLAYSKAALSKIRTFYRRQKGKLSDSDYFKLKEAESNALINLGSAYRNLGKHKKSLSYFFEAKEICEEIGLKKKLTSILINIGGVFYN
ncbi:MAG: tetratricopeptide repeat protein [Crocinitomicaceae bacterium]|nr:tetratricopeptide repeat protein [Crocinitomicaceae bacterium]